MAKYKAYPETKIIGGKRFHKTIDTFTTKKQAQGTQARYHADGYSARVVKIAGVAGYAVYFRGLGYR